MKSLKELRNQFKKIRTGTPLLFFLEGTSIPMDVVFIKYNPGTDCVQVVKDEGIIILDIQSIRAMQFPFNFPTSTPVIIEPCRQCIISGSGFANPEQNLFYQVENINPLCDCSEGGRFQIFNSLRRQTIIIGGDEEEPILLVKEDNNNTFQLDSIIFTGLDYEYYRVTEVIDPLRIVITDYWTVFSASRTLCNSTEIPTEPFAQFIKSEDNSFTFNSNFWGPVEMDGSVIISSC